MTAGYSERDFDNIFEALGWKGKYQILQLALLNICKIPVVFGLLSVIFIGYPVTSHCKEGNISLILEESRLPNSSIVNITYNECSIVISHNVSGDIGTTVLVCVEGRDYTNPRALSLASEWDLVCGKESLSDLLQTLNMLGMAVGSVVFGVLADRKGRKFTIILSGLTLLAVGCGMAFVPTYIPFAVLKVIQGACEIGIGLTVATLQMELVPTEYRSQMGVLNRLSFAIATVIYAIAAYLMKDFTWRYHQLTVGLTAIYFLILPWTLHESYRWLGSMKKHDQIECYLRKAARMNGKDEEVIVDTFRRTYAVVIPLRPLNAKAGSNVTDTNNCDDPSNLDIGKDRGTRPIIQIIHDRQILSICAVICAMWFTDSVTYYGLHMTSTEFHSNKYLGFGLNTVMEIASVIAYWLTIERFGRKMTSVVFRLVAGVSLLLAVLFGHFTDTIPSFKAVVTTLSLSGKFAITVSLSILWLYTPELFPTNIRNAAFGVGSVFARIGGLFAPFSRTLFHRYPWVSGTIFGSCCILVTVFSRILPETTGHHLTKTVPEMKEFLKNKRSKSKTHTRRWS